MEPLLLSDIPNDDNIYDDRVAGVKLEWVDYR